MIHLQLVPCPKLKRYKNNKQENQDPFPRRHISHNIKIIQSVTRAAWTTTSHSGQRERQRVRGGVQHSDWQAEPGKHLTAVNVRMLHRNIVWAESGGGYLKCKRVNWSVQKYRCNLWSLMLLHVRRTTKIPGLSLRSYKPATPLCR